MYQDTIANFAAVGEHKAQMVRRHLFAFLIGSMMAGAYIGFGDIILFTSIAHLDSAWSHLIGGSVFAAALTICVFAGSDLFTGTAMYMPFALANKQANLADVVMVWISCWIGNLAGAILLAAIFHMAGGGVLLGDGNTVFFNAVAAKMSASSSALFARGLLCNWLVCLAIWMSSRTKSDAAKLGLIFWPIMIFVASGFEHSVANMFAFAMALLGDHPANVTLEGAFHNEIWVTLGNLVGGGVMVAAGYLLQRRQTGHASHSEVGGAVTGPRPAKAAAR
jgi:nitrite transporter NirC